MRGSALFFDLNQSSTSLHSIPSLFLWLQNLGSYRRGIDLEIDPSSQFMALELAEDALVVRIGRSDRLSQSVEC